ncbi:multiple coagulation factor deficiency protein 2 homolog [Stegodyphus dumicola]|uniref:multiple coagulation factor deficiency protein 2 homolog n=1 Tax=Stegodyphus dumicola TaxID=202533 RepID=UPI0015A9FDEC|nr:multiple coagulation factor deficiency protein 2 homolog [Stegodyphus dumicola]
MSKTVALVAVVFCVLFLEFADQELIVSVPYHWHEISILATEQDFEIRNHLQKDFVSVVNTSVIEEIAEEELIFLYFKMHDYDKNNKLDGCELVKSFLHWHEEDDDDTAYEDDETYVLKQEHIYSDNELADLIDLRLENDDKNNDGFLDYEEFTSSQNVHEKWKKLSRSVANIL